MLTFCFYTCLYSLLSVIQWLNMLIRIYFSSESWHHKLFLANRLLQMSYFCENLNGLLSIYYFVYFQNLIGNWTQIWLEKINKKHQNLLVKNWKLRIWYFICFICFMWLARFQILICEPQSIWCKLLVLSWLYSNHSSKIAWFCGEIKSKTTKLHTCFALHGCDWSFPIFNLFHSICHHGSNLGWSHGYSRSCRGAITISGFFHFRFGFLDHRYTVQGVGINPILLGSLGVFSY